MALEKENLGKYKYTLLYFIKYYNEIIILYLFPIETQNAFTVRTANED